MRKYSYADIMAETDAFLRMKLKSGEDGDPVGVAELALALTSISDMYDDFAKGMGASEAASDFVVTDLRKGSAELVFAAVGIGLMDQALVLHQFHGVIKANVTKWVSGKVERFGPRDDSQAKKVIGLAEAVRDSENGEMTIAYEKEGNGETERVLITNQDAEKMIRNFGSAREAYKEDQRPAIEFDKPQRVLMRLYQHNQDPSPSEKKRTSHKAVVRDIDSKPRPLTYENSEVSEELNEIVSQTPYGGVMFDVDLELVREDAALKAYRLLNIHGYFDDPDAPLLEA